MLLTGVDDHRERLAVRSDLPPLLAGPVLEIALQPALSQEFVHRDSAHVELRAKLRRRVGQLLGLIDQVRHAGQLHDIDADGALDHAVGTEHGLVTFQTESFCDALCCNFPIIDTRAAPA